MTQHRARSASDATTEGERFRALIDHLEDGFCVVEVLFDADQRPADYRFIETNAAFLAQTGLTDVIGKRMRALRPEYEDHWFEAFGRVATSGESVRFEAQASSLGRWFDVRAFRVDAPQARHVGILSKDTTGTRLARRDREELLAAERAARAAAETAARAKSQFLAVMSHELRTPINAFTGYLQLLEMELAGPITEQQRRYLERMSLSASHLLTLVGGVLDLAKVDAGELHVVREQGHTGDAVDAALALTAPQAAARGVTLIDRQVGTDGVPYVGDEQRVRQILANLIANAVKFTEPGGQVVVTCHLEDEAPPQARVGGGGPWAAVSVIDTGIGIAEQDQQRIFEEFHQIDARHTRVHGGTGLGLAISRRLARLMGGDLTVKSAPGEGSVFTLWLPAGGGVTWGVDGEPETADARGERAQRAVAGFRVHSCSEIGDYLRSRLAELAARYVERLRVDHVTGAAAADRARMELEDHVLAYLGDLCQSLLVADEHRRPTAIDITDLHRDSLTIQRTIAELHGRQRQTLGWTESQLLREHEMLRAEIIGLVREHVPAEVGDVSAAIATITRGLERSADTSLRSFRRSALTTSSTDDSASRSAD